MSVGALEAAVMKTSCSLFRSLVTRLDAVLLNRITVPSSLRVGRDATPPLAVVWPTWLVMSVSDPSARVYWMTSPSLSTKAMYFPSELMVGVWPPAAVVWDVPLWLTRTLVPPPLAVASRVHRKTLLEVSRRSYLMVSLVRLVARVW